jgi:hypothetical protein
VSAHVPGIDYRAEFHVPVFATPASDPSIRKGAVDPSHPTERPADAKSAIVAWGGERTVFALGRAKGLGCGVIAFVLLPLLGWAFGHYGDYLREDAVGFVKIGLVAGTVILAFGCVAVLVTATRLEIDADAIRVQHGTWLLRWRRTIPVADVTKIEVDSSNVQLVNALTKDGKSYWISGTLSGPQEAKWFATEVARALERHRGPTGRGPGVGVS